MNNAYEVALEKEIWPMFEYSERIIDIGSSQSLFINANQSRFAPIDGRDDYPGMGMLSYRWECQAALQ